MTDIDSNRPANTRMDQDNEKNVATPKPGGNDSKVINGQDIDEASRDKIEAQRRERDEEQRLRKQGDKGINIEGTGVLERDKHIRSVH